MKSNAKSGEAGFDAWAHSLLQELEQQTPEAIRRQRSSERQSIKIGVQIRPGNASDRVAGADVEGVTGDVSTGGCRLMTSRPLRVGDVYQLRFDKQELDLPIIYARCLRCRLVREDAFESGFVFFEKVELSSGEPSADAGGLL